MIRSACIIIAAMTLGTSAAQSGPDADFQADVASMESCVLETAHVGAEDSCTGLISSGCVADGHPQGACVDHETRVWAAIARDMSDFSGEKIAFETGCGADDGSSRFARCQMQATARIAAELLLKIEG